MNRAPVLDFGSGGAGRCWAGAGSFAGISGRLALTGSRWILSCRIGFEKWSGGGGEVILNAATYTAVDRTETERDAAMAINGEAARVLAEEARRLDAVLVHYSTDYGFDGSSGAWTEEDAPSL